MFRTLKHLAALLLIPGLLFDPGWVSAVSVYPFSNGDRGNIHAIYSQQTLSSVLGSARQGPQGTVDFQQSISARFRQHLSTYEMGLRGFFDRWGGTARGAIGPQYSIHELLLRFSNVPAASPAIIADPSQYRFGQNRYVVNKIKSDVYFRQYFALALDKEELNAEEADALQTLLNDPKLLDMTMREVDAIVYTFIQEYSGNPTPSSRRKAIALEAALTELPWIQREMDAIEDMRERGRRAMELATIGNQIGSKLFHELAYKGVEPFSAHLREHLSQPARDYSDDDRNLAIDALEGGPKEVLYLLDNVVEHVYDLAFIGWLLQQGHTVRIAVKEQEADNDVTVQDMNALLARSEVRAFLGPDAMQRLFVVHTTGPASRGFDPRRPTKELGEVWEKSHVIFAKGEGSWGSLNTLAGLRKGIFFMVYPKSLFESPGLDLGKPAIRRVPASQAETMATANNPLRIGGVWSSDPRNTNPARPNPLRRAA